MNVVKKISSMCSVKNGGKIYGLARMHAAGLPVPKTFAISPNDQGNIRLSDYKEITNLFPSETKLAIRSSALGEDGKAHSFAGIFESVLNVPSNSTQDIKKAIRKVIASSKSLKTKSYSQLKGPQMGIIIQEMIQPVYSGVAFTDSLTEDGKNAILIEFTSGLGDKLVSGKVDSKKLFIPYASDGSLNIAQAQYLNLSPDKFIKKFIQELIHNLSIVKDTFKRPMDTEWAVDADGKIWMLQARPITKQVFVPRQNTSSEAGIVASYGKSASLTGKTYFVDGDLEEGPELDSEIRKMPKGSVLILTYSDTYYLPAMRKASAIISTNGSVLSHAAIVARELGIPCIVGVKNAHKLFPNNTQVTINTSKNEILSDKVKLRGDKSDMDWGELFLFENIKEHKLGLNTVLFEELPDGTLAVYLPDKEISQNLRNKIEVFARTTYKQAPKIYQTEKYLWYFENKRFKNLSEFDGTISSGEHMLASLNTEKAAEYFDCIVNTIRKLKQQADTTADNPFYKFMLEESVEATHFAGLMRITQGAAIRRVYKNIKSLLDSTHLNFVDFISLPDNSAILHSNQELMRNYMFLKTLERQRNDIFQRLLDEGLMRPDYFEDRNKRARQALAPQQPERFASPVELFYSRLAAQRTK